MQLDAALDRFVGGGQVLGDVRRSTRAEAAEREPRQKVDTTPQPYNVV